MSKLFVFLIAIATINCAEPRAIADLGLRPFVVGVMSSIVNGDESSVIEAISGVSALDRVELQRYCGGMLSMRARARERLGGSLGWEIIGAQKSGDSLIRVLCLDKMRYGGISWSFSFYKGEQGWFLSLLSADDAGKIWSGQPPLVDLLWTSQVDQKNVMP